MIKKYIAALIVTLTINFAHAQEVIVPLRSNLNYIYRDLQSEVKMPEIPALKTQSATLFIPFKDDFYYAPTSNYPDQNKWSDLSAYVNAGFPIAPPSIGVATFDGLNQFGFPYYPSLTNNNISRASDTLTSKPLNLRSTAASQTLQPVDSVALSFYYQARGYGDAPELTDSLILDFYSPTQNKWSVVWFAKGNANGNINDTVFKRGFAWISDTGYLRDNFKFRFRNKSAGTGNYDHWHLDYVYLDKDRSQRADTIYKDVTFAYVPTPLLRDYSAMPFEQYTASEMASRNLVRIKNNGAASVNMTYENKLYTSSLQQLNAYSGGAFILKPFRIRGYDSLVGHATPTVNYVFPLLPDSTDFILKHYIFESGSSADFIPENDTLVQYQRFRNYYAIDDGSAEAGYYLNVSGGRIATRIKVNVPDSFLAVRIYFDPVTNVNAQMSSAGFRINVWPAAANGPGQTAIFTDTILTPQYYNFAPERGFGEYKLRNKILLQPGIYYIGIQQRSDYMTLGFDMNTDHRSTTFYDLGAGWTQSTERGSVMIRPVFGKTLPPYVGIDEVLQETAQPFKVFPNPASSHVEILCNFSEDAVYMMINSLGQIVQQGIVQNGSQSINSDNLHNGLYLLSFKINNRVVQQQKVIIQH